MQGEVLVRHQDLNEGCEPTSNPFVRGFLLYPNPPGHPPPTYEIGPLDLEPVTCITTSAALSHDNAEQSVVLEFSLRPRAGTPTTARYPIAAGKNLIALDVTPLGGGSYLSIRILRNTTTQSCPTAAVLLEPLAFEECPLLHTGSASAEWPAELFPIPSWITTGSISEYDARFLYDLVRSSRATRGLEVGVASGASSAVILTALADNGSDSTLTAVDLSEYCYFDPARRVGSAVAEMVPHLASRYRLHAGKLALDILDGGSFFDFAFIDANHWHPWPTLDVLVTLPHLKVGSYLALHDLALPLLAAEWPVYGPRRLFRCWTGEKVLGEPNSANIGALRKTQSHEDYFADLMASLRAPWEAEIPDDSLDLLRPVIYDRYGSRLGRRFDGLLADRSSHQGSHPLRSTATAVPSTSVIDGLRNRDWLAREVPTEIAAVPTMLNPLEQKLLHFLAETVFTGGGEIVDAGCFLGGSTSCLASGLDRNTSLPSDELWGKIHTFDRFRVEQYTLGPYLDPEQYRVGDSFLAAFDQNTRSHSEYFTVHEGDILDVSWDQGEIEILFLDLCKSRRITDHVTRTFFPHLIPGRSIVVQQDYLFTSWNAWIHITMELFADYFELITHTFTESAVFLCTAKIPGEAVTKDPVGSLPFSERLRLLDRAISRWPIDQRRILEQAKDNYLSLEPELQ